MKIQKILIVDDDPNVRLIAQIGLEGLTDWTVLLVDNGLEALEIAANTMLDIILLDVRMPVMDGLTTLSKIRERNINTPVIFMTANVQSHEIENYIKSGALGVISKPFDPMTLADQITALLTG